MTADAMRQKFGVFLQPICQRAYLVFPQALDEEPHIIDRITTWETIDDIMIFGISLVAAVNLEYLLLPIPYSNSRLTSGKKDALAELR